MTALLFDLDDTLYARQAPFAGAMRKCFPQLCLRDPNGNDISMDALYRAFSREGYDLYEDSIYGRISMEEMYIARIRRTLQAFSADVTDEEALAFQSCYAWEQAHLSLSAPIRELLTYASQQGAFLGVVTNGASRHQRDKYEALGLEKWISPDHFLPTGDLGVHKPDPAPLLEAQRRWSLRPADTWYIGDSLTHDVACAAGVGWHTIWLDRAHTASAHAASGVMPEVTVSSEEELYLAVQKLLQERA